MCIHFGAFIFIILCDFEQSKKNILELIWNCFEKTLNKGNKKKTNNRKRKKNLPHLRLWPIGLVPPFPLLSAHSAWPSARATGPAAGPHLSLPLFSLTATLGPHVNVTSSFPSSSILRRVWAGLRPTSPDHDFPGFPSRHVNWAPIKPQDLFTPSFSHTRAFTWALAPCLPHLGSRRGASIAAAVVFALGCPILARNHVPTFATWCQSCKALSLVFYRPLRSSSHRRSGTGVSSPRFSLSGCPRAFPDPKIPLREIPISSSFSPCFYFIDLCIKSWEPPTPARFQVLRQWRHCRCPVACRKSPLSLSLSSAF